MALLAAAVYLGATFAGVYNLRAASDQADYHLLVIEQFSRQFPHPDFSNYRSATGPGYHVVIAAVHRWVTTNVLALRAMSSAFAIALLALLGWATGRRMAWPIAVIFCLPALASLYVFSSGVWLLPDDLAWLTVLAAVLLAFRDRVDAWTYVATAVVLAAAVFVRQINLWPLGALCLSAMMSRGHWPLAPGWFRRLGLMLLAGLPALLVLVWFHHLWHGLTPPAFQHVIGPLPPWHSGWQHEGPNFAVPTMVLAVLGVAGAFYAPFLWPLRERVMPGFRLIISGGLIGALAAIIVKSNWNEAAGRYSGLWNISKKFPVFAERSTLMIAMAALGGATIVTWFVALNARDRWIWFATWACFIAAQAANAMAWHKYYEPFCLMMFALAASRLPAGPNRPPRWVIAGPLALAALLAGVTILNLK